MSHKDDETTERARTLRAEAEASLARAAELRRRADEEEQDAWRARAAAAVIEACARRTNQPARRRPRIQGDPRSSVNRLIAMMETLCIDEHVNPRDGLDTPLRLVESHLGICYGRRGMPAVGTRLDICERAMTVDVPAMAA